MLIYLLMNMYDLIQKSAGIKLCMTLVKCRFLNYTLILFYKNKIKVIYIILNCLHKYYACLFKSEGFLSCKKQMFNF